MLLAVLALALGLIFGAPGTVPPASQLPGTWPGFSQDEGVFLVTQSDSGSQAAYFIAQNQRHSITTPDLQQELAINPLRPVRGVGRDEVLGFAEGAPVGSAAIGLVQSAPAASAQVADAPVQVETPSAQYEARAEDATYLLQPGDNLTHISARFGVDQATLMAANGISNPNRIYVGQILVIPGASEATPAAPAVAEAAPDEHADASTYTVQPGDSAFLIARRFGVDQQALLQANRISNPNRVYAGQTLQIPSST